MTSRLYFVRHGSAPKVEGLPDAQRALDAKGIWQAETRRQMLGNVNFDFGFASPLKRAQQTLDVFMGGNTSVITIDELGLIPEGGMDGMIADIAFNLLGYKPLTDYFKDPHVKKVFSGYGETSGESLKPRLIERFKRFDGSTIGICGHAVNLPATLRQLALTSKDQQFAEFFVQTNLQELDGCMVEVDRDCNILTVDAFTPLPEYQAAA